MEIGLKMMEELTIMLTAFVILCLIGAAAFACVNNAIVTYNVSIILTIFWGIGALLCILAMFKMPSVLS
jgi:hypothetical protein